MLKRYAPLSLRLVVDPVVLPFFSVMTQFACAQTFKKFTDYSNLSFLIVHLQLSEKTRSAESMEITLKFKHSDTPVSPLINARKFEQSKAVIAPNAARELMPELSVRLANSQAEVLAAQRLRYQIFSSEYGLPAHPSELDADAYDPFCDHLLVIDMRSNAIVGTYRMLNAFNADLYGRRYGQDEFSSSLWQGMSDNMVELGRACIHPDYRSSTALLKLWQGIMDYLAQQGCRYAIGYASVSLKDGGYDACATAQFLNDHAKPWTGDAMMPLNPYQFSHVDCAAKRAAGEVVPLIKGYVRLGAFCIGHPAWDAAFNTADFPMLLDLTQLDRRYAKHFKVPSALSNLN